MRQDTKENAMSEKNSDGFQEIFNVKLLKVLIKKVRHYAKKHFNRFSAILVAVTTIGLWLIRACGYIYQSAKLAVYNIDKSYISLDDNFFLQIIEGLVAVIIIIVMNYIYFCVAANEDGTKLHLKRKCHLMFLGIIESLLVIGYAILEINYGIDGFIKEIRAYSFATWIKFIMILVIGFFSYNSIGILAICSKRKAQKDNNKVSCDDKKRVKRKNKRKESFRLLIMAVVMLAFVCLYIYVCGMFRENHRVTYKVILEQTEEDMTDNKIFSFENDDKYLLYIVVYENEDVYILCQLYKSEGEISIDTNYQRLVSKYDIVTYTCDDIYKISYTN